MTKQELIRWTKKLFEEAAAIDMDHLGDAFRAITGVDVASWDSLKPNQLHAIASVAMRIARM